MPGAAHPWDQSEDPRDQTVDLPRIDLASFANGLGAPDPGSAGAARRSLSPPDPPPRSGAASPRSLPAPRVPAEPPLAPLPPLREPAGRPDRDALPGLLPRRLPDSSRDPYARAGEPAQPGALFRPAEPGEARRRDRDLFRPAEPAEAQGPANPDPAEPAGYSVSPPLTASLATPLTTAPPPAVPAGTEKPLAGPAPAQSSLQPPAEAPAASGPDTRDPDSRDPDSRDPDSRDPDRAPSPPPAIARRRTAPARPIGRPAPGSIADLLSRLDRLPDGHPSSPYEDGGLARPLPHRLRQLELGLPAPGREAADLSSLADFGAPARSSAGPAARPAAESGPAPASGADGHHGRADAGADPYAPPAANGHGDSGRRRQTDHELALEPSQAARAEPNGSNGHAHADGDQEQLVAGLLAACKAAEGKNVFGEYGASGLTPAIRRIAHQLPRGGLAPDSEADTLKPRDRLTAKLARLIARHPGRSPEELAAGIGDGVRYAFTFDPDYYTEGTWLVHRKLKAYGFELEARRNRWDSPEYRGVWTRWRDPAHDLAFEVQFHTGQSWDVLKRTHAAYVQITDPATSAAERARLRARQVGAAASARAPANCAEIADFGREAR